MVSALWILFDVAISLRLVSKFTLLFERLAIDWLREAAVTAVARQLKLGWDAVWGIERRAVARGLERRGTLALRYVGVDEKSFQRRHDYVTVVSDLEGARVLFVADDRKRESLEAFWALGLTAAQRTQVEAIAMDMWEPYVQATRAQVPDAEAKIVFDRFHCAEHLNGKCSPWPVWHDRTRSGNIARLWVRVGRTDEGRRRYAPARSLGSVTVPGLAIARRVASARYAAGSTPASFADSISV